MLKPVESQNTQNKRKRQPKLLTFSISLPIQRVLNWKSYSFCICRFAASKTVWYDTFSANSTPTTRCAPARHAKTINFPSAAPISQTTFPYTPRLFMTSCVAAALILPFTPLKPPSPPPAVTNLNFLNTRLYFCTGDRVFQSAGTLRFREVFKLNPRLFLAIQVLRSCSGYDCLRVTAPGPRSCMFDSSKSPLFRLFKIAIAACNSSLCP